MSEAIANHWFDAVFPAHVVTTAEPTDVAYGSTTAFSAEIEPFGLFSIRVTQLPIDAFLAVGARRWIEIYGDQWSEQFAEYEPLVLHDESEATLGGAMRKLVVQLSYHGSCGAFVQLWAHPDRDSGRIVVAAAIVGLSTAEKIAAINFLNSVRPKWAPPQSALGL